MKWIDKNIWWILCTLVLGSVLLFCVLNVEAEPLRFSVACDGGTQEITLYTGSDGVGYLFLPSYAKMEQVRVILSKGESITIGDTVLTDGMDCGGFALETDYVLKNQKGKTSTLRFFQSANVATIFVETQSGKMDYIHRDKTYSESATLSVYGAGGEKNYSGANVSVSGRGNATWGCEKKPYSLTLPEEADLLNMGRGTQWILLANAMDATNLKNKMVLDMAKSGNAIMSPDCVFVDVFLNGEYSGVYLLTEKVEASKNRLELDSQAGDFLCLFELDFRWDTLQHPFVTDAGRVVEIRYPETLTEQDNQRIQDRVKDMEKMLLSNMDIESMDSIDMDSWVHKYIIDEISANIDADRGSCFFYQKNGVLYAGPVWDYDMTFGSGSRNMEPVAFVARNKNKSKTITAPYYSVLNQNESFHNRVKQVYQETYLPILENLLNGGIEEYAQEIAVAVKMNHLRWPSTNQKEDPIEALQKYVETRTDFLNRAWIEEKDYCTVHFEVKPGEFYQNASVERGGILKTEKIDLVNTQWLVEATGERFDFTKPIDCDLVLIKRPIEQSANTFGPTSFQDYVVLGSVGVVAAALCGSIVVDICRRRKKRRRTDER